MWDRLNDNAKRAVHRASHYAGKFGEGYISTEHILLALLDEARVETLVTAHGLTIQEVRAAIEAQLPWPSEDESKERTLTPRAKRTLDLAYDESRYGNQPDVGPEHLFLGLIREGDGVAGRVLQKMGFELELVRTMVLQLKETGEVTGVRYERTKQDTFLKGHCIRTHLLLSMIGNPDDLGGEIIRRQCKDIGALQWHLWYEIVRAAKADQLLVEVGVLDRILAKAHEVADGKTLRSHHILVALLSEKRCSYLPILDTYGVRVKLSQKMAAELDEVLD